MAIKDDANELDIALRRGGNSARTLGAELLGVDRGVVMTVRHVVELGEAIKHVATQGEGLAFLFSASGPLVGAIAIAAVAITEGIVDNIKKAKEEALAFSKSIGDLANRGDVGKLKQQLQELRFGTPFDPNKPGELIPISKFVQGAFKGSLLDLEAEWADTMAKLPPGVAMVDHSVNELAKRLDEARNRAAELTRAIGNVANQPAAMSGLLPVKTTATILERPPRNLLFDNLPLGPGLLGIKQPLIGGEEGHRAFGLSAPQVKTFFDGATENVVNGIKNMADQIQFDLASGLGDALSAGFRAAFAKGGNLGDAGKALLGSALSTLGGVFERLGIEALAGLTWMQGIKDAIMGWFPEAGIAKAVGLIAFGALLQGIGGRLSQESRGRGGGGAGFGGGSSSGATIIDRGLINPANSLVTSPSGINASGSVVNHIFLIGKDDPRAQRDLLDMVDRGRMRRGDR